jgi:hypothetical protein
MDLVRFAELLNSQGELRDLWVKQKVRERAEKARIVRERQKSKIKS